MLRVRTSVAPLGARLSTRALDEVDVELDRARIESAYQRGRTDAVREAELGAARALADQAAELEAARERATQEISRDAVLLAVEIAGQLLKVRIAEGEYDLERIVRSALDDSGVGRSSCTVHLHPDDFARVQEVDFRSGTLLESDSEMKRGEVHVSTPRGLLVRDLGAALETVREQLLEDLA
ncbi:MAG: hypothetical protein GY711_04515 [bacterium]|nr:hypothetical protein [bacterium]